MPVPVSPISWLGSLLWLVALIAVAFAVSWVGADRLRLRRPSYIGLLTVTTAAVTTGYVAWSRAPVSELLATRWAWGLMAAPLSGAFLIVGLRKLPVVRRLRGRELAAAITWEGIVYGLAEAVLLSALPAFMTWQMVRSLAWSGVPGAVARWTLPIVASVAVIVSHHLGYWEYRNRLLVPISVGCGLMTVGYLVTASPLAPALAHVLSHASCLQHGGELPPHARPASPRASDLQARAATYDSQGRGSS